LVVEHALNVKLNFQFYAFADLAPKFGTLLAGDELPDFVSTLVRQDIPLTPELFDAKAANLAPFVSGEAIEDYPNLTALPTRSWNGMIFDNKIDVVAIDLLYPTAFEQPVQPATPCGVDIAQQGRQCRVALRACQ
jgi:hypothetical protein